MGQESWVPCWQVLLCTRRDEPSQAWPVWTCRGRLPAIIALVVAPTGAREAYAVKVVDMESSQAKAMQAGSVLAPYTSCCRDAHSFLGLPGCERRGASDVDLLASGKLFKGTVSIDQHHLHGTGERQLDIMKGLNHPHIVVASGCVASAP